MKRLQGRKDMYKTLTQILQLAVLSIQLCGYAVVLLGAAAAAELVQLCRASRKKNSMRLFRGLIEQLFRRSKNLSFPPWRSERTA